MQKTPSSLHSISKRMGLAFLAVAALIFILLIAEFLIKQSLGAGPYFTNATGAVAYAQKTANGMLSVVLIDTLLMGTIFVFLTMFHTLLDRSTGVLKMATRLFYMAGIIFVILTLIGDAMEGAASLDALTGVGDIHVIRAFTEGHTFLFGFIGLFFTFISALTGGIAIYTSKLLRAPYEVLAFIAAGLNFLVLPTLYGGPNQHFFFSAGGLATTLLGTLPFLLWIAITSIGIWSKSN